MPYIFHLLLSLSYFPSSKACAVFFGRFLPWIWAVLYHLLAILPPLVSVVQYLKLWFCFECNSGSSPLRSGLHNILLSAHTYTKTDAYHLGYISEESQLKLAIKIVWSGNLLVTVTGVGFVHVTAIGLQGGKTLLTRGRCHQVCIIELFFIEGQVIGDLQ